MDYSIFSGSGKDGSISLAQWLVAQTCICLIHKSSNIPYSGYVEWRV